jgi:hypothetical protein
VTSELNLLRGRQHEDLLEVISDPLKPLLTLHTVGSLCVLALRRLARRASPKTDTPEGLADVDVHAHDLIILIGLERLTNGRQHKVEPDVIVSLAVLEGEGPATAVLVLRVLPLGAYTALEEMVVGLLCEL